ncbi:MAG TPA: ATP-binding protein [Polyangiaceae bacterium]|nr:ATP-binding protein [Polyangiaceae bacterium]
MPRSTNPGQGDFVGRAAELAVLERELERRGGAFVPVYGRRRVGKSELILHFLSRHRGIYHVGKEAPATLQVQELLDAASVALDEPLLRELRARDWRAALVAIEERFRGPGKLVLALDEFQWSAAASPELPSILQELWDTRWRRSGKVMLILCGSFVGFMERDVLGEKSPLFGRRTAQIHLAPFGYRDAGRFHPSWSVMDQARAWFICGGIPAYLLAFDEGESIESNVETTLLSEYGPLFHEPEFLLREELRDVSSYHGVLMAVAAGAGTAREIAERTGLPERSLPYYLEQLVSLGYVGRRYPVFGRKPAARHVRFSLEDALLRFWFRFVFPHKSAIVRLGSKRALDQIVRPSLDSYFGSCFERLCRDALADEYASRGVTGPTEVGSYWDKHVQIDVVGVRGDHRIDLAECKWGPVRSRSAVEAELAAKAKLFPNPDGNTVALRWFTRTAPKSGAAPGWTTLDDLYAGTKRAARRRSRRS